MSEERRPPRMFPVVIVLLMFALISLISLLGKPSIENIRAVDIVHLLATGMCLGAALVALVINLRLRRHR